MLLAAALTVTSVAVTPTSSDAAKKIKLAKKTKTIKVGDSYTLKLKNGKKKAKVTWKVDKKGKAVVKLSKKVKAGNKASVKVTGKKAGTAKVTANYKYGKAKVKKYTCKFTVREASTDVIPALPTATQGGAPASASASAATNVTTAPTGDVTPTGSAGDATTKPTKTPKPPKTPTPVPTPKESGKPAPTEKGGYFDVMAKSYVVLAANGYEDGSPEIRFTENADGSQTLDFTGVTGYIGCRWYFGTKDADGTEHPENLNLSDYKFLVVEGTNQTEGFGANDTYDLVSQFLDGVQKADHGGPLEICTNNSFRFPIEMDLSDASLSNTDLSNVCAYEIYIPSKADSKKVGPFTITGIKAFKDKAAYEKYKTDQGQTPAPTATPEPPVYGDYTFDFSDPNCYRAEQGGSATYNATDKSLDVTFGDYQGLVFLLPNGAVNKYNSIEMTYTLAGGDVKAYVYDGDFNGNFGQYDPGSHEVALEQAATDKTVTFTVQDDYAGNCVKGLKLFNWAGNGNGTMKIKSLKYIEAPGGQTPPPATPVPTDTPKPTEVPERVAETLDLSKVDVASTYEDGKIVLTDIGQVIFPISAPLYYGEEVSVKINGELAAGHTDFRAWIGNGGDNGSDIQMFENMADGKFSIVFDTKAKDFAEGKSPVEWTKFTIKKKSWDSDNMTGITITKIEIAKKGTLTADDVTSETPAPTATPTLVPTRVAETLDLSKVDVASTYSDGKLVLNDVGQVVLPITDDLELNEEVSVKINGVLAAGHTDFRAWIGNGNNSGSDIAEFKNLPDGKFSMVVDIKTKEFGENDNPKEWTKFTLKKISYNSANMNGITITKIEVAPKGTLEADVIVPDFDASGASNDTPVAHKVDTAIVADGKIDKVWDSLPYYALKPNNAGEVVAIAKLAWDGDNLYVFERVKDDNFDSTSTNNWERDGGEVFLDEDLSKENTYGANTDAFQYRLTGFDAEATITNGFTAGSDAAKAAYAGIQAAYQFVDDGYIIEYAIPWANKDAIKTGKKVGFELSAFDCADGKRAKEMMFLTNGGALYQNPSIFGTLELYTEPVVVAPKAATVEGLTANVIDISKAASFTDESVDFFGPSSATYSYDAATGVATYALGGNLSGFSVVMPEDKPAYDKVEITYSRTKGSNDKIAAFVYDGKFNGNYGNGGPGSHEEAFPASDEFTTVTFEPKSNYDGNCIKALKIYNYAGGQCGSASTLKIKSIKFIKKADVSAKTYELTDVTASTVVRVANTSKYGDFGFEVGEFDSYVDDYDSIYAAVDKLYKKDGGTVEKYLEDGEVTYKATDDGVGTLTIKNAGNEFTADVTVVKDGKDITATFVSPAKKLVVKVNSDNPNVATMIKNDVESFTLTLDKDAAGNYDVVAKSDQGRYAEISKNDGTFVVTISDSYFDTYSPVVSYVK